MLVRPWSDQVLLLFVVVVVVPTLPIIFLASPTSVPCSFEGAPNDAFNQAEGYRYLSRLVRAGLENFIECNDARAPRFNAIVNGFRVKYLLNISVLYI